MSSPSFNRNLGRIYLYLVPVIASAIGFGIGHVHYSIYLPVWILNIVLMVAASWAIGFKQIKNSETDIKESAWAAFFLIVPWILISMFAGLGPPPETAADWSAYATEQQVRYFMLVMAGVSVVFGISLIKDKLVKNGEKYFSRLAQIAILVAIPIFIINMLYWGFYLTELFKNMTASGTDKLPEGVSPIRQLFGLLSVTEVALTYLATAFLAAAFRKTGWFNPTACRIYIVLSIVFFFIIVLSAFIPGEFFKTAGFIVSIPASPFLMLYLMGINLLLRLNK